MSQKIKSKARTILARAEKRFYPIVQNLPLRLPFPDFMVIGAMKGATTWLFENLARRPDVFMPKNKEDYFFSHDFFNRSLFSYLKRFRGGRGLIKGEVTPGYGILSIDRIKNIHAFNPELRLIFIARNPIDRSWSEAIMNLVDKPKRPLCDVTAADFLCYVLSEGCRARSNYCAILTNWLSVFPRDQVFVGLYDDVGNDPETFLRTIFRHIGLKSEAEWNPFPADKVIVPHYETNGGVNGGVAAPDARQSPEMPPDVRAVLWEMYEAEIICFGKKYNLPVAAWLDQYDDVKVGISSNSIRDFDS